MIKEEYDVIVVGGGPAGSTTARVCAENGLDVLLLEKRQEIGAPVRCGEGFSKNNEYELKMKIPQRCISNKIEGAWIYAPNGKRIEIISESTKGYILERKQFDKWLAEEAAKSGVKIITKASVFELLKENGLIKGVKVKINGEDIAVRSSIVVAADGVESLMLRMAGIKSFKKPYLVDAGFQYLMSNIELERSDVVELYIGKKIAPRGYIWVFPKSNSSANIGIGINGAGCERTAKEYLDEWIEMKKNFRHGSIIEIVAGCIPVGGLMKNMVGNGILGVGDAVNQVNPIHGGGIAEAIHGGRIAGEVIVHAHQNNDFSSSFLEEYNKKWWEIRGNKLKRIEKVREIFENMSDEEMNTLAEIVAGKNLEEMARGKTKEFIKLYLKFKGKSLVKKLGL